MKPYQIALCLLIGCVMGLSASLIQTRRELTRTNRELRDAYSQAFDLGQTASLEGRRAEAFEDALRQEKDRQQMIESGVLTPGWLARRLAIERGLIVPMQDARSETIVAYDKTGHRFLITPGR